MVKRIITTMDVKFRRSKMTLNEMERMFLAIQEFWTAGVTIYGFVKELIKRFRNWKKEGYKIEVKENE